MAGPKQAGPQMPQTEMCPGTCRTFHAVLGMCLWSLFAMGVKHMGALEFEEVSPLGGGRHHPLRCCCCMGVAMHFIQVLLDKHHLGELFSS